MVVAVETIEVVVETIELGMAAPIVTVIETNKPDMTKPIATVVERIALVATQVAAVVESIALVALHSSMAFVVVGCWIWISDSTAWGNRFGFDSVFFPVVVDHIGADDKGS